MDPGWNGDFWRVGSCISGINYQSKAAVAHRFIRLPLSHIMWCLQGRLRAAVRRLNRVTDSAGDGTSFPPRFSGCNLIILASNFSISAAIVHPNMGALGCVGPQIKRSTDSPIIHFLLLLRLWTGYLRFSRGTWTHGVHLSYPVSSQNTCF